MDLIVAAARTQALAEKAPFLSKNDPWVGRDHIMQMLSKIIQGEVTGEKAHRWLGWAQCAVCMGGGASLNKLKEINFTS